MRNENPKKIYAAKTIHENYDDDETETATTDTTPERNIGRSSIPRLHWWCLWTVRRDCVKKKRVRNCDECACVTSRTGDAFAGAGESFRESNSPPNSTGIWLVFNTSATPTTPNSCRASQVIFWRTSLEILSIAVSRSSLVALRCPFSHASVRVW